MRPAEQFPSSSGSVRRGFTEAPTEGEGASGAAGGHVPRDEPRVIRRRRPRKTAPREQLAALSWVEGPEPGDLAMQVQSDATYRILDAAAARIEELEQELFWSKVGVLQLKRALARALRRAR